ncbi:MAG: Hsp20/alpha crystallin family protein [Vicinamibacterales bacterium]
MAIVRWDPFRELSDVQERVNRVLGEFYGRRGEDDVMRRGTWVPPVDIMQKGSDIVLKAELPDMKREDIDIRVENNTLIISGEKKFEEGVREEDCHRIERAYGRFSRSFSLPATIDTDKVGADYKNGVLTVKLPIREEAKPRQIQVQVS